MPVQIQSIAQAVHDFETVSNNSDGGIPERHIDFMIRVLCYSLMLGYKAEREPQFGQGKLIFTYNKARYFTIRSTKSGLWVEFNDPNHTLVKKDPYLNIPLKYHKPKQYEKTKMNRSKSFESGENELKDVYDLLSFIVSKNKPS
jgi:hypothetical protein